MKGRLIFIKFNAFLIELLHFDTTSTYSFVKNRLNHPRKALKMAQFTNFWLVKLTFFYFFAFLALQFRGFHRIIMFVKYE